MTIVANRIAVVEWMQTQEALPGEDPSMRWRVPETTRPEALPEGLLLYGSGGRMRLHPWSRVRHIDYEVPVLDMGGAAPTTTLPMQLPDSMRIVSASVDGEPVPATEQVIRPGDTVTISKEAGARVEPLIGTLASEAAVLDKLAERQGRKRGKR